MEGESLLKHNRKQCIVGNVSLLLSLAAQVKEGAINTDDIRLIPLMLLLVYSRCLLLCQL